MGKQMRRQAQAMLADLPEEERPEMTTKNRWTCDSYWMMAFVMAAGWDLANKTNLDVLHKIGHVEMQRLIRAMELKSPEDNGQFMLMLNLAMEAFLTKDYFDYEFREIPSGIGAAMIHQCYPNTKVRSIGVQDEYACGCFGLRAGWYQAMNVRVNEKLTKCLIKGDDHCEIVIEDVSFPVQA